MLIDELMIAVKPKMSEVKAKLGLKNIIIIVCAVIILAMYIMHRVGEEHFSSESPLVEVKVASVEVKDMPFEVCNIGTVVPLHSVVVNSRIDSQVSEILFKDGDQVTQGQVLFLLDDKGLQAQLRQLEADVIRDQAQLNYLKSEYERTLKVYQSGYETKEHLDQVQSAYEAQIAIVKATEESVNNIKTQLDYAIIIAPISGKAGTINTNVGDNVKANDTQSLVTINQIDPIRVKFPISQKYFEAVHSALSNSRILVKALITETKEEISGYLEYIENVIDQNDNFAARAVFPNKLEKLWPGMYVNVVVTIGYNRSVNVIPRSAIARGQDDKMYVYVVENNKAKRRDVEILTSFDEYIEIKNGLSVRDRVILNAFSSIVDGTDIKIIQE